MNRRNTIQRALILETVNKLRRHATADDVYDAIVKKHPNIGRGTVYRNLKVLSDMGEIQKVEIPGGADRYDFKIQKHYHIRCIKCDRIFDVEMEPMVDLESNIKVAHGFKFIDHDIIFKGICPECDIK